MAGTGIFDLDRFMAEDMPKGMSLVYYTQPGVDGEIFGLRMICNTLKKGGRGIFVVSSMSPEIVKNKLKDMGWCNDSSKDNLTFVDSYNQLIGFPSKEKYVISNPSNIKDITRTIVDLLEKLSPSTIVFGNLSTIMDLCGEKETTEAVKTWNDLAKLHNHVMIYNFTAWSYSFETMEMIKKQLFDAVISIGGISDHFIFSKCYKILKLEGIRDRRESIPFESETCWDFPEREPPRRLGYDFEGTGIAGDNDISVFPFR